jgi:glutathione S-transferase
MTLGRLVLGTRRYSSWSMRGWLAVRLAGLLVEEVVVPPAPDAGRVLSDPSVSPSRLVPYLEHAGARVWDSLAIMEYCAERAPALWPAEPVARAHARAIAAEMHAGFADLRQAMPMNLGGAFAGRGQTPGALENLMRIEAIWAETRARWGGGGPYLFGAGFGAADAMYAPVVARLISYVPPVSDTTRAYMTAVRAHPLVQDWYAAAAAEPEAWRIGRYEAPG